MNISLDELNRIHLLGFIKLTNIHFGIRNKKTANKPRMATQSDIDRMMGRI